MNRSLCDSAAVNVSYSTCVEEKSTLLLSLRAPSPSLSEVVCALPPRRLDVEFRLFFDALSDLSAANPHMVIG